MILILDNQDSFVYNLSRYFRELGEATDVVGSHYVTLDDIEAMQPKALVISPGPCTPNEAGVSLSVISHFSGRIPILGVCLGHQVIAQSYGAVVTYAQFPKYGQASSVTHDGCDLFKGLPNPLTAGLYHSLIVTQIDERSLIVQAKSPEGEIMALRHRQNPTFGVQFHPESILSQSGHELLHNFVQIVERFQCSS